MSDLVAPQDLTSMFELGPELGRGAFGAVHRARERATGRAVALKLLLTDRSSLAFERFLREAAVAATLDHPGIVRVHASGPFSGRPCIVYELVEGAPLGDVVPRVDHRRRVELVRDAALAVGHAHAQGVIHRDLKPDNLLVDHEGRVRVTDFGLALLEGADRLTRTGALAGTPTHMAPEQFAGTKDGLGPQVDVWALGVVLYQALTGRLPFDGASLVALASAINAGRLAPPRTIDPTISRSLEALCLRALSRDPAARPADGTAFAHELDLALANPGTVARGRMLVLVLVLVLLLVLVLVLVRASGGAPSAPIAPVVADQSVVQVRPAPIPPVVPVAPVELRLAIEARWALFVAGDRVLTGGPTDDVRLWELTRGDLVQRWSLRTLEVARRSLTSVLVTTLSGELYELELGVDAPVRRADLGEITDLACAGAQGRLAVLTGDRVELRDAPGERVTDVVTCARANELALSADGARLAVCTNDADNAKIMVRAPIFLWDIDQDSGRATGPREVVIPGRAKDMIFSADGARLFAATSSRKIVAIDVARGEVEHAFEGTDDDPLTAISHAGSVNALALSPDGRWLYSCGLRQERDLELKVWDVAARTEVTPPVLLQGEPRSLEVSPDGARLLIGAQSGGVHVRRAWSP